MKMINELKTISYELTTRFNERIDKINNILIDSRTMLRNLNNILLDPNTSTMTLNKNPSEPFYTYSNDSEIRVWIYNKNAFVSTYEKSTSSIEDPTTIDIYSNYLYNNIIYKFGGFTEIGSNCIYNYTYEISNDFVITLLSSLINNLDHFITLRNQFSLYGAEIIERQFIYIISITDDNEQKPKYMLNNNTKEMNLSLSLNNTDDNKLTYFMNKCDNANNNISLILGNKRILTDNFIMNSKSIINFMDIISDEIIFEKSNNNYSISDSTIIIKNDNNTIFNTESISNSIINITTINTSEPPKLVMSLFLYNTPFIGGLLYPITIDRAVINCLGTGNIFNTNTLNIGKSVIISYPSPPVANDFYLFNNCIINLNGMTNIDYANKSTFNSNNNPITLVKTNKLQNCKFNTNNDITLSDIMTMGNIVDCEFNTKNNININNSTIDTNVSPITFNFKENSTNTFTFNNCELVKCSNFNINSLSYKSSLLFENCINKLNNSCVFNFNKLLNSLGFIISNETDFSNISCTTSVVQTFKNVLTFVNNVSLNTFIIANSNIEVPNFNFNYTGNYTSINALLHAVNLNCDSINVSTNNITGTADKYIFDNCENITFNNIKTNNINSIDYANESNFNSNNMPLTLVKTNKLQNCKFGTNNTITLSDIITMGNIVDCVFNTKNSININNSTIDNDMSPITFNFKENSTNSFTFNNCNLIKCSNFNINFVAINSSLVFENCKNKLNNSCVFKFNKLLNILHFIISNETDFLNISCTTSVVETTKNVLTFVNSTPSGAYLIANSNIKVPIFNFTYTGNYNSINALFYAVNLNCDSINISTNNITGAADKYIFDNCENITFNNIAIGNIINNIDYANESTFNSNNMPITLVKTNKLQNCKFGTNNTITLSDIITMGNIVDCVFNTKNSININNSYINNDMSPITFNFKENSTNTFTFNNCNLINCSNFNINFVANGSSLVFKNCINRLNTSCIFKCNKLLNSLSFNISNKNDFSNVSCITSVVETTKNVLTFANSTSSGVYLIANSNIEVPIFNFTYTGIYNGINALFYAVNLNCNNIVLSIPNISNASNTYIFDNCENITFNAIAIGNTINNIDYANKSNFHSNDNPIGLVNTNKLSGCTFTTKSTITLSNMLTINNINNCGFNASKGNIIEPDDSVENADIFINCTFTNITYNNTTKSVILKNCALTAGTKITINHPLTKAMITAKNPLIVDASIIINPESIPKQL